MLPRSTCLRYGRRFDLRVHRLPGRTVFAESAVGLLRSADDRRLQRASPSTRLSVRHGGTRLPLRIDMRSAVRGRSSLSRRRLGDGAARVPVVNYAGSAPEAQAGQESAVYIASPARTPFCSSAFSWAFILLMTLPGLRSTGSVPRFEDQGQPRGQGEANGKH